MKREIITAAAILLSTSALAGQESKHYLSYFEPTATQQLITQSRLYNEENGYWGQNQPLNQELVRHLNQIELDRRTEIAIQNESFGYWQ